MRKASQGVVGKVVATVLFGILIISFAIWGIGDIFRATPQNVVARVGQTDITTDQFRVAFHNEFQRINRQFGGRLTQQQARAFGLDQQVLARLVNDAILNERAKDLGLSVSDQLVVRTIADQPAFRGPDGQFNRAQFEAALRDNGLTEAGFVREQRNSLARLHLAEAIGGAISTPLAAQEAQHRFQNERRAASYLILQPAAAGEVPAPTQEQLQAFYQERKASFRTPEFRALSVLPIDPAAVAKPDAVSDADARQRYEQNKASFGTPERRTVQQIAFPSQAEAEAAFSRIKEGTTFEAIAAERGVSPQDLEIGTLTKAEMLDSAVADAAFSLEAGAVSGPVQGRFGTVLVRATKIEPEAVKPFEDVAADVKTQLAIERARTELDRLHDQIEDMRASARPLADIAAELKLNLVQIPAVDQEGRDKAGNPVANLPEGDNLVRAAFASDIGVDNEGLRARTGGYVWFDVTGIEPPRDKTLDEVRAEAERQWRNNELSQRLAEKGRQLAERLDKGESIETLAAEVNAPVKSATDIARRQAKDELTTEAVARVFATPVGKAASAPNGPDTRAVFKVTAATVPPLNTTTQQADAIKNRLREALGDTLLEEYVADLQKDIGVTVN
ncbi:MAG TPA: SurA N-terminal domain-containing protein, partial [Microvirga sp.]|nr:SurA N-terminal domain-containing protein [Microvirga sp.]